MDNQAQNRQQGGTGGAEQTNREREEQKNPRAASGESEKSEVASQIGEKQGNVKTIADLGGMSGRDDASGGSGDRMEKQQSNEQTDTP